MSRLDAALRRASTGVVAEIPATLPRDPHTVESVVPVQKEPERPVVAATPPAASDDVETAEPLHEAAIKQRFGAAYVDKLVVSAATPGSVRENYRRLAATLHHAQAETGIRILMVTSAAPEEGKTLTATNIALTFSESYHRRVLLIDGDLRRPSLAEVFQVPNVFGLSEVLTSQPERRASLLQITQRLSLLTAGTPNPDPMRALTSDRMKHLLAEAAAGFDWVIIDSPPVGILTDAKLLAAMVDAAVLVVRAGKTRAELVQRAIESVGRSRIVGVVLNRALGGSQNGNDYYSYYDYSKRKQQDA